MFTESMIQSAVPMLDEALRDGGATAWIGDSDTTALGLMDFLVRRNVRIPADLAVTGFDNSSDGQVARLTSYDFCMTGVAHARVSHILNPAQRRREGNMTIEGLVIPRLSTEVAAYRSRGPSI